MGVFPFFAKLSKLQMMMWCSVGAHPVGETYYPCRRNRPQGGLLQGWSDMGNFGKFDYFGQVGRAFRSNPDPILATPFLRAQRSNLQERRQKTDRHRQRVCVLYLCRVEIAAAFGLAMTVGGIVGIKIGRDDVVFCRSPPCGRNVLPLSIVSPTRWAPTGLVG